MIVLETIGAIGAVRGIKMNGKILGVSFVTIALVVLAYLAGAKFPGPAKKALAVVGQ